MTSALGDGILRQCSVCGWAGLADHTLALSDAEVARYRMMARQRVEVGGSPIAGCWPGAGCGRGRCRVWSGGHERAASSRGGPDRAHHRDRARRARARHRPIPDRAEWSYQRRGAGRHRRRDWHQPRSVDIAMTRHVLAHNGRHEQAIVDHLATLPRAGGTVYLADVDLTALRIVDADPELDDLSEKYARFHAMRGNDPRIGLRLSHLLRAAGLEVVSFTGSYSIIDAPPGMRPPKASPLLCLPTRPASTSPVGVTARRTRRATVPTHLVESGHRGRGTARRRQQKRRVRDRESFHDLLRRHQQR